jgi:hypothetical protein
MLEWFFADMVSVQARAITALAKIETDDTAVATLKFRNGALGIIERPPWRGRAISKARSRSWTKKAWSRSRANRRTETSDIVGRLSAKLGPLHQHPPFVPSGV